MYPEGPTLIGKLEGRAGGTEKLGPHVDLVGPKSMLNLRKIGDLRVGGVLI